MKTKELLRILKRAVFELEERIEERGEENVADILYADAFADLHRASYEL